MRRPPIWRFAAWLILAGLLDFGCGIGITRPAPTPSPTSGASATSSPASSGSIGTSVPGPVYTIPSSIDATGATDVAGALNEFVASVPDGATIAFPAGKTYAVGGQFLVDHRRGLTFLGNGTTIKSVCSDGAATDCSVFAIRYSSHIVVRDLVLTGNSPTPGVFDPRRQGQIGFRIVSGSAIEIDHCRVNDVYADGVDVDFWTDGVWVHDSTFYRASRAGFVVLAAKNVTVEHNTYVGVSNTAAVVDLEAYEDSGGTQGLKFIDNTITGNDFYFAANYGAYLDDITISGNVATSGTIRSWIGKAGPRPQRVTITNNRSLVTGRFAGDNIPGTGGIYVFDADDVTVTGNNIPFSPAHQSAALYGCTSVKYDGK